MLQKVAYNPTKIHPANKCIFEPEKKKNNWFYIKLNPKIQLHYSRLFSSSCLSAKKKLVGLHHFDY